MSQTTPNFETDLNRLATIVDQLGQGDQSLEDAIVSFEEGIKLSNQLQEVLTKAQTQLNQVVDDNDESHPLE